MATTRSPITTIDASATQIGGDIENFHDPEDNWRQMEDDDFPDEFFSSIDLAVQSSRQTRQYDTYPGKPMDEPTSPEAKVQSSNLSPARITLLTRPSSSHEDPAAGFSFTKAKPVQPLDFSRKTVPNANIPLTSGSPTFPESEVQTGQHELPDAGQNQAAAASIDVDVNSRPSSKPEVLQKQPFVPFPMAAARLSKSLESTIPSKRKDREEQPLTSTKSSGETSHSCDTTLVDLEPDDTNYKSNQDGSLQSSDRVTLESPQSAPVTMNEKTRNPRKSAKASNAASLGTESPATTVPPLPTALITRRKKQAQDSTRADMPQFSAQGAIPPERDLLQMLLQKHKQNDHERRMLQTTLRTKEADYQELFAASEDLLTQLNDISQRFNRGEQEIQKIRKAREASESKLKKLSDYVKGLTNDHNRLRDDAKSLQDRQRSLQEEKKEMLDTLRNAYQATEESQISSQNQLMEARHEMELIGQTLNHQQTQLQHERELLLAEKERNSHLETQASTFSAQQAQLLEVFDKRNDTITAKVSELIDKSIKFQEDVPSASQDHLRPLLEQYLSIFKDLPAREGDARNMNFQKLSDTVHECFEKLASLVTDHDHGTAAFRELQQQLQLSVTSQLHELSSNIATEHKMNEQIIDLREVRATIRERLFMTEKALQDARKDLAFSERKNSEYNSRIVALENNLRLLQPQRDPALAHRLQELELLNRELQKDVSDKTTEARIGSECLGRKEEEIKQLQERCSGTEACLEEAHQQVKEIQQEKSECEKTAALELEETRRRLSKAADQELEDLKSKHLNAIQQLKQQGSLAEERYTQTSVRLVLVEQENVKLNQEVVDTRILLEGEQKRREERVRLVDGLRLKVAEVENRLQEQHLAHGALQQLLHDTELDNRSKDDYIKAMQEQIAAKSARSPSNHGPKSAQTPRVRAPVVVKDSQPNGRPDFASHTDIMRSRKNSQDIESDGDFNDLFPTTPKGQSKELEFSRVTYSSTKVTSREGTNGLDLQQTKHRPSREALPHPGSNGKIRPSSSARKSQANFTAPQTEASKTMIKADRSLSSSQLSGSMPKSILKLNVKDPRGEKRSADQLETNNTSGSITSKRSRSNMTRDLGPVVPDSQSPDKVVSNRFRKQTSRKVRRGERKPQMF